MSKRTVVMICLSATLLLGGIAYWQLPSFIVAWQMKSAWREEHFPGQESAGYHELLQRLSQGGRWNEAFRNAALRCLSSCEKDRWGNLPVVAGAVELIGDSDPELLALNDLYRRNPGSRYLRQATLERLLRNLSSRCEAACRYNHPDKWADAHATAHLYPLLRDTLQEALRGDNVGMSGLALECLGGMAVPETLGYVEALPENAAKRLQQSAYEAVRRYAHTPGYGAAPRVRAILLKALKEANFECRKAILQGLSPTAGGMGLWLTQEELTGFLDSSDPLLLANSLRVLCDRNATGIAAAALRHLQNEDDTVRRFALCFLEKDRTLKVEALLPLCKSTNLILRYSALCIAHEQIPHVKGNAPDMGGWPQVFDLLKTDSDPRLAAVANWYAGSQTRWEMAARYEEELRKECFDRPRALRNTAPKKALTKEEAEALQAEHLRQWKQAIVQGRSLFASAAAGEADSQRQAIYQTLIDHYVKGEGALLICLPGREDCAGLRCSSPSVLILSEDQAQTMREDLGYDGPVLTLSEVYLDPLQHEARVQLSWHFAPKWGHGTGIVLRFLKQAWRIQSEEELWIS